VRSAVSSARGRAAAPRHGSHQRGRADRTLRTRPVHSADRRSALFLAVVASCDLTKEPMSPTDSEIGLHVVVSFSILRPHSVHFVYQVFTRIGLGFGEVARALSPLRHLSQSHPGRAQLSQRLPVFGECSPEACARLRKSELGCNGAPS